MRRAQATAVAGLLAVLGASACSTGAAPQVDLSEVAGASGSTGTPTPTPTPTETVTVTQVETQRVTAVATVVTTATVTATPTVTVTALPHPSLTTSTVFNRPAALAGYGNLVSDVRVLDRMALTGNAAALQLDLLAQHLAQLGANGAPPGLDAPSYYGRLASLVLFAQAAAEEAAAASPVAQSRYAVIRQETGVLLSLVNGALATTFALPLPAAVPRPTTTAR